MIQQIRTKENKMNIGYARVSTGLQIALKQKSI